jgi:hypothetical protein
MEAGTEGAVGNNTASWLKEWISFAQEKVSVLGGRQDLWNLANSLPPFLTSVDCKQLNQKELLNALTLLVQILELLLGLSSSLLKPIDLLEPSKKLQVQRQQVKIKKIYLRLLTSTPYIFSALFSVISKQQAPSPLLINLLIIVAIENKTFYEKVKVCDPSCDQFTANFNHFVPPHFVIKLPRQLPASDHKLYSIAHFNRTN